jgi:carboxyl-terminal processing protease
MRNLLDRPFVPGAACFALLLAFVPAAPFAREGVDAVGLAPSCSADCANSADPAVRLYAQALDRITRESAFASGDRAAIVRQMLNDYLSARDPYSGYLSRDEYAAYRQMQTGAYAGIGADLERHHDGETLIFPFPQGPAERAGIRPGERLVSIGSMPVKGKPLAVLAAWATGQSGTQVKLELANQTGVTRIVTVAREPVSEPAVSEYTAGAARVLKLAAFTAATSTQLKALLARWKPGMPIIIDLRGCGGGEFYGAVDSAMLFLKKDEPVVSVVRRDGVSTYASTIAGLKLTQPVFLWQDGQTASAAELFIAALTENGRATSVGRTSAGKGSRQDIEQLSDGSALILTTGYLSTPHNVRFDGRGLAPQRPVAEGASTAVYLRASGIKE